MKVQKLLLSSAFAGTGPVLTWYRIDTKFLRYLSTPNNYSNISENECVLLKCTSTTMQFLIFLEPFF